MCTSILILMIDEGNNPAKQVALVNDRIAETAVLQPVKKKEKIILTISHSNIITKTMNEEFILSVGVAICKR